MKGMNRIKCEETKGNEDKHEATNITLEVLPPALTEGTIVHKIQNDIMFPPSSEAAITLHPLMTWDWLQISLQLSDRSQEGK